MFYSVFSTVILIQRELELSQKLVLKTNSSYFDYAHPDCSLQCFADSYSILSFPQNVLQFTSLNFSLGRICTQLLCTLQAITNREGNNLGKLTRLPHQLSAHAAQTYELLGHEPLSLYSPMLPDKTITDFVLLNLQSCELQHFQL